MTGKVRTVAASNVEDYGDAGALAAYQRASHWRRSVAVDRCASLLDVAALQLCGANLGDARGKVAARRGVSVASLKRWGRLVRDVPRSEWTACLLPKALRRSAP